MVKYELARALNSLTLEKFTSKSKYYSDIICFDIETTSYSDTVSFMYVWQISLNGCTMYGRTWSEFKELLDAINDTMNGDEHIIIWVHNLSFEFAFLEGVLHFDRVFATSAHKVVYADYGNIRFRCTYMMSNKSLASIAKDYKLPVKKLVGDLDYRLTRHSKTPITAQELEYCENDVLILHYYIKYMIKQYGSFSASHMPITSTGFVRKLTRENAKTDKQYGILRKIVKDCSPVNPELYNMLRRAFGGGQTHASYLRIGEEIKNVASLDKKSFYPAAMVRFSYPQQFRKIKREYFFKEIKRGKAVIADIYIKNVVCKYPFCTISQHKCCYIKGGVYDNGKVYKADELIITVTELDFDTINKYYDFDKDSLKIGRCYSAYKKRLPKSFIKTVLQLYKDKTELKNIKGREIEYAYRKALLNSLFGMCVTDILQDSIIYNNHEWDAISPDTVATLEDYRDKNTSILLYQTGVYITAYCRHEILENDLYILQTDPLDLIYNDTDSIKLENYEEKYKEYFENFDKQVRAEMQESCKYYGFSWDMYEPEDIKGNKHLLGTMDYEGNYKKFKTLGAKRYIYTDDDNILHATVAGCPKNAMTDYLNSTDDPFYNFNIGLVLTPEKSMKNCHHYCKPSEPIEVTDYLGNKEIISPSYGISILPTSFEMNMSNGFKNFLTGTVENMDLSNMQRLLNAKKLGKVNTFREDYLKECK
ncbi:MAG: hypothetical protein J6S85_26640 [Methanobrevibacter sp.]|nr:hypothetical protein [Methanobrevibacter sp.]MBO7717173.1 hypothetical protein [Methanobrevibacter sp.]